MKPSAVVAVALVLLAAGCGKPGTPLYTKAATAACLRGVGLKPEPVSGKDFVAQSAPGGAFAVRLTDNRATVSFGDTIDKADNIAAAYRRFAGANIGIDDVLRQQGNAVMLWDMHPADADMATVTGCLAH